MREDRTITWSGQGDAVGFQHGKEGVFVADRDGGGLRKIFQPGDDVLAVSPPLWAPSGGRLLFTTARPTDVAGHPAYSVRISPKASGGLFGGAELAWDAARGIPLRFGLYARNNSTPVLELAATNISYGGDSGSLVTSLDDVALGLLFAGSSVVTIVNHIETVRALLRVDRVQ